MQRLRFLTTGLFTAAVSLACTDRSDIRNFPPISFSDMEQLFKVHSCPVSHVRLESNLNSDSVQEWKLFRTRIREGSRTNVNFCGHYILVFWGCGTECQSGVIIDASSGRIYGLPTASRGYKTYVSSCLLVLNPLEEPATDRAWYAYPAYYLWDDSSFRLLADTRIEPPG